MNNLSNQNINFTVSEVEKYLSENNAESKESIRLRLMLEEVLIGYQKHFGENREFTVRKKSCSVKFK